MIAHVQQELKDLECSHIYNGQQMDYKAEETEAEHFEQLNSKVPQGNLVSSTSENLHVVVT